MYHYQTMNPQVSIQDRANEIAKLDDMFLLYRVNISLDVAKAFLEPLGGPWASFIAELYALFSEYPNAVTVWIGREYSRVIYVEIVKTYFSLSIEWALVAVALAEIGNRANADEHWIEDNSDTRLLYRFWWD